METIKVNVSWNDHNFEAFWALGGIGAVVATGKTLAELKDRFRSALEFQVEGLVDDGSEMPKWLRQGDFEVEYSLDAAALIRNAEEYTSIAAISRASGINIKQLSHYANNIKKPRAAQRQRILDGIHAIGRSLMAVL